MYSGVLFDPINPDVSQIDIDSIGHALSNLCRFGGHCSEFYSIAQHAVLCARFVFERVEYNSVYGLEQVLATLHHDDTEGLGLVDLPRPVKHAEGMHYYREVEQTLDKAVQKAFDLKGDHEIIKLADDQLLVNEMRHLAPLSYPFYSERLKNSGIKEVLIDIRPWTPSRAKQDFINMHKRLVSELSYIRKQNES